MGIRVRFEILGPLRCYVGDQEVVIKPARERVLLATLLLHAGEPVPLATLVDTVWDEHLPRNARSQIHGCVWRLRKRLADANGDQVITTEPSGYRVTVAPQDFDLCRFRHLRDSARAAASGRPSEAVALYRAALALWRGPVLAGIENPAVRNVSIPLEEERLQALGECLQVELAQGKAGELIPELAELVRQHAYREDLHGALILALYRAGRQADALAAYQHARELVRNDLGIEPSESLQDLHKAILNRDPELDAAQSGRHVRAGAVVFQPEVPRMLPPDIPDFVGRVAEIERLQGFLAGETSKATRIAMIAGQGGVGKTALSVHMAHRLQSTFSDGQLYVNLHGFAKDRPVDPAEALGRFLRALGVDGANIEGSVEEHTELYRRLIADRRILVVLDNAATESQVLPLVPGGSACGVIINSRVPLGHSFGAEVLRLAPLDTSAAETLVTRIAGAERSKAEAGAVRELARLCGWLPLAVRVAAGRLAIKPHWSIERFTRHLRDERQRLDHLSRGLLDVRASISLSYAGLDEAAQRLLRRLCDMDVATTVSWIPAALLDVPPASAEQVLEELFDAQLVDAVGPDETGQTRYRVHDLVRLFAKERAEVEETREDLAAARQRAFGAWLFMADGMYEALDGGDDYRAVRSSFPRWEVNMQLADMLVADPQRWLDAERVNIIATVGRALTEGVHDACWDLACITSPLFRMRRCFDDWALLLEPALTAAQQSQDDLAVAVVLSRQAELCTNRRDFDQAWEHFQLAASLFSGIGNRHGYSMATAQMAMIERFRGEHEQALAHYREALAGLRATDDRAGEARVLRSIGQIYLDEKDEAGAERHLGEALALYHRLGERRGEAQARFWLGMLRLGQARTPEARDMFKHALTYSRELDDRSGEIQALRGLGLCYQRAGDVELARHTLTKALQLAAQPRPTLLEEHVRRALEELRAK